MLSMLSVQQPDGIAAGIGREEPSRDLARASAPHDLTRLQQGCAGSADAVQRGDHAEHFGSDGEHADSLGLSSDLRFGSGR